MPLTLAEHLGTPIIEKICPLCKLPLQEEDLLEQHFINMAEVCTDCYLSQPENQDGDYVPPDDGEEND